MNLLIKSALITDPNSLFNKKTTDILIKDGIISTLPARAFYSPASATQQYDQLTIATYDPATGR
ncbi:hypothetical protein EON65_48765, partial [archaeon]